LAGTSSKKKPEDGQKSWRGFRSLKDNDRKLPKNCFQAFNKDPHLILSRKESGKISLILLKLLKLAAQD